MTDDFRTRAAIAFERLNSLIQQDTECLFLKGHDLIVCTVSACWMAKQLGGQVYGYYSCDNPDAEIGKSEGGHDFVLQDRWIIDAWAHGYFNLPLVLNLNDPAELQMAKQLYGLESRWIMLPK